MGEKERKIGERGEEEGLMPARVYTRCEEFRVRVNDVVNNNINATDR